MLRSLIIVAVSLAAVAWLGVPTAGAQISRNNPYRSFNVTGVNYGSMQWQKSHGKASKSWSKARNGGRWIRRR